jgi:hypothetical protein
VWFVVGNVLIACKCSETTNAQQRGAAPATQLIDLLDSKRFPQLTTAGSDLLAQLQQLHQGLPVPTFFDRLGDAKSRSSRLEEEDGFQIRGHKPFSLEVPIAWGETRSDPNWHSQVNAWRPLDKPLAAYLETGDTSQRDLVRKVIFDWIAYNIISNKPNEKKWQDTAVGIRAEKLAFVIDDGLRKKTLDVQQLQTLLDTARRHQEFLSDPKNLARGNHAVFMLAGLSQLCKGVPELAGCVASSKYVDKTWPKTFSGQFTSHGIHLEGAPTYHLMMLRMLDKIQTSHVFNESTAISQVTEKAKAALHAFYHPNGEMVMIGDSEPLPISSAAKIAPDTQFIVTDGNEGPKPVDVTAALTDAGYFSYRSPWDLKPFSEHSFLFFSSSSRNSKHSQHDDFTFEWSERGIPILVDSGKFTYAPGGWRKFFESTRAGNTVEIDGKDNPRDPVGSRLSAWSNTGDLYFVEATVRRKEMAVEHTRLLVGKPRAWLCVVDELESTRRHVYRQWFGAHEALQVEQHGDSGVVLLGPKPLSQVAAQVLGSKPKSIEIIKGAKGKRPQGWISRRYDEKEPRSSFAFRKDGSTERFVTVFSLQGAVTSDDVKVEGDHISVEWSTAASGKQGFSYANGSVKPL